MVTTVKMLRGAQDTKKIREISVRRIFVLRLLFFLRIAVAESTERFDLCWEFLKAK